MNCVLDEYDKKVILEALKLVKSRSIVSELITMIENSKYIRLSDK